MNLRVELTEEHVAGHSDNRSDRRRKWSSEERRRILAAAFALGAVISNVARQFDVASSMIYKWRGQARAASRRSYFVFHQLPSVPVLVGGAFILAGGLIMTFRQGGLAP
jgi:hypothetical protein